MQNLSSTFIEKKLRDKDNIDSRQLIVDDYKKSTGYFVTKRIIDIAGSLFGIVIFSPIMILTAMAIKLSSKGPVFFAQERVGQDSKVFKMYKFRSMIVDAEELLEELKDKNEMSGPMFKMKEDPRVTKVGKFIRKTSIDELPQLFNVLKGHMSLVGPRPNLPREVEEFETWMRDKLIAKPGLTCYWQVMGRNDIDFQQWMELDIKYVKERSLLLDIKLILRTFRVLVGDKHAR